MFGVEDVGKEGCRFEGVMVGNGWYENLGL